jgi:GNAT superfamily N-acetyltransferase
MSWTLTDSIDDYLAGAGGFLRSRPVQHTIELGALARLLARGPAAFGGEPPLFGWWRTGGRDPAASVFHTPPFPLLISGLPAAAAAPLASELAARARHLPGVNAQADQAASFAAAWRQQTGVGSVVHRRSRLFQLGDLVDPRPMPPGSARIATDADGDLLGKWLAAFAREISDMAASPAGGDLADRLSYGGLTLWEVAGTPVAMAGTSRPGAGVVRVGPVFTPSDQRRQGYGGAVTAAVSRAALEAGAVAVVLFTDLANPTSNALYPRLGYRPVADRVVLAFGPLG